MQGTHAQQCLHIDRLRSPLVVDAVDPPDRRPGELDRLKRQLRDTAGRIERLRLQAAHMSAEARSLADVIDCLIGDVSTGLDLALLERLAQAATRLDEAAIVLGDGAESVNAFVGEL